MADRVVVFFDYQNTYMGARRTFHQRWDPWSCGQFDPVAFAQHVAQDSKYPRVLTQVRIYRGLPDATKQPGPYAAARRQHASWQRDPLVHLVTRPLKYPQNYPNHQTGERPQEKGIDVQLTLDFAVMASRGQYDIGIMVSTDTDLKPALEFVADLTRTEGKPRAEVAAWSAEGQYSRRLAITGRPPLYCHWVGEDVYKGLKDTTDYTIGT
ncbi:NYN domain-containing protein [Streptomyces sp. NRRL WC-3742]|uniref:NYN domain-containing protein n=1 Tax=Streptomyces sp. NRRL WC-3742 TaxID=1463934 RepID=UPI0004CB7791|nr:NYN domain-containing protein [Streptomyces sp. NRRL WC-3742]